jgi:hypothetical protein
MNTLAIAGLTLFWLGMFRVGALSAWLIAAMMVTTGWFDNAVTIYHPDLIAGYGAAIVASLAIFQSEVLSTTRRRVMAGTIAGLILLTKPTAMAMVLALWGVAFIAGMLAARAAQITLIASLRRSWIPILLIGAIAGPYFSAQLPALFSYVYTAFVTQHSTWIHLSTGENPWTFFVARTMELFGIWLFLGAGAFAIVIIGAMRGRQSLLISFGGLSACLVVAYIVPTVVPIQVMLYGSVLYGMVLVAGLVAATRLNTFPPIQWGQC